MVTRDELRSIGEIFNRRLERLEERHDILPRLSRVKHQEMAFALHTVGYEYRFWREGQLEV